MELAEVTRRLEAKPGDAALLLRRATLHRVHEDYAAAKADLLAVKEGSPHYSEALLHLARLEREAGHLAEAEKTLARYFAHGGDAPEAYREQARLDTAAQRNEAAVKAWKKYLGSGRQVTADDSLDAAEAQGTVVDAQRILVQALEKFPASIPLQQRAALYDLRMENVASAEERFAWLRERYPTLLPRLYHEEGTIWQAGKQPEKAQECFERALKQFDKLPAVKQHQPGLQQLRADILTSLNR